MANHYAGTMSFVDEYWRIIHRAAGWAALRTWLLVDTCHFIISRLINVIADARPEPISHWVGNCQDHKALRELDGDGTLVQGPGVIICVVYI